MAGSHDEKSFTKNDHDILYYMRNVMRVKICLEDVTYYDQWALKKKEKKWSLHSLLSWAES
jgi:hypothetical protein